MPNRSEILPKSFSAFKKTPEMVDFGFLKAFKKSISHVATHTYSLYTCIGTVRAERPRELQHKVFRIDLKFYAYTNFESLIPNMCLLFSHVP